VTLTASVEGVDRLVDTLDDAARRLVELAPSPAAGDLLVAAAIPVTPRDKGDLVKTVAATVVDQDHVLVAGGGVVDYAAIVHANRPWLADTIRDRTDQVIDTVDNQVTDIVTTIEGA
jgi:hypothetical protein